MQAETLECPGCGEEVWDGPHGHKLAKCWGCGLAFDTMDDDEGEDMNADTTYVVIENTPGYLPDDDDPATFDDYRDALRYMVTLVRENRDFRIDGGEDVGGWLDRDNGCAYLVDEGRPHDLGRSFEILAAE